MSSEAYKISCSMICEVFSNKAIVRLEQFVTKKWITHFQRDAESFPMQTFVTV